MYVGVVRSALRRYLYVHSCSTKCALSSPVCTSQYYEVRFIVACMYYMAVVFNVVLYQQQESLYLKTETSGSVCTNIRILMSIHSCSEVRIKEYRKKYEKMASKICIYLHVFIEYIVTKYFGDSVVQLVKDI